MLVAQKRGDQIRAEDTSRNWRDYKVKAYLSAWASNDKTFDPDRRFDELICFLFPEVAEDLPRTPR